MQTINNQGNAQGASLLHREVLGKRPIYDCLGNNETPRARTASGLSPLVSPAVPRVCPAPLCRA